MSLQPSSKAATRVGSTALFRRLLVGRFGWDNACNTTAIHRWFWLSTRGQPSYLTWAQPLQDCPKGFNDHVYKQYKGLQTCEHPTVWYWHSQPVCPNVKAGIGPPVHCLSVDTRMLLPAQPDSAKDKKHHTKVGAGYSDCLLLVSTRAVNSLALTPICLARRLPLW